MASNSPITIEFQKSFTAPGCGPAAFATLGAYREHGVEARAWHAAVVAYRKALVLGEDVEGAEIELHEALARLGADRRDIQDVLERPYAEVATLFLCVDQ